MKKILIFIDVLMIGFLLLPFVFTVEGELHPEYFSRVDGRLSVNTEYMLISFVPFLAAILWLIVRYTERIMEKYPFVGTPKFRVIVIITTLIIVFSAKAIVKS